MASEALMLLLSSMLLGASDVLVIAIDEFSDYLLDKALLGRWWNNKNQDLIWIAMD
jgi:hypothetical protein